MLRFRTLGREGPGKLRERLSSLSILVGVARARVGSFIHLTPPLDAPAQRRAQGQHLATQVDDMGVKANAAADERALSKSGALGHEAIMRTVLKFAQNEITFKTQKRNGFVVASMY